MKDIEKKVGETSTITLEKIIWDINPFLDKVLKHIQDSGISFSDIGATEIDHIGVRTESNLQYEETKNKILGIGSLESEILIRDRRVSTFRLAQPIIHAEYQIGALELLAPTENNSWNFGPEHIEVVVSTDLLKIMDMYPELPFKHVRPDSFNPELILSFPDMTAVKFHPISLLKAVVLQKENGITEL